MKHGSVKGRDCKGAKFGCDSYTDYYQSFTCVHKNLANCTI